MPRDSLPDYDEDLPIAKKVIETSRDFFQQEKTRKPRVAPPKESPQSRGGQRSVQSRKEKRHIEK
jgi:hypothetical protein